MFFDTTTLFTLPQAPYLHILSYLKVWDSLKAMRAHTKLQLAVAEEQMVELWRENTGHTINLCNRILEWKMKMGAQLLWKYAVAVIWRGRIQRIFQLLRENDELGGRIILSRHRREMWDDVTYGTEWNSKVGRFSTTMNFKLSSPVLALECLYPYSELHRPAHPIDLIS